MKVREPSAKYVATLGYKQTEAGTIPNDWRSVKLVELFNFQNGVNADKAAYGRGIPFVNVLEVITHGTIRRRHIPGKVVLPASVVSMFAVQPGDVLFNRTSETQEEVGMASVYAGSEPVVFGGFVIRGSPRTAHLLPRFASYALRAPKVREQIVARGQGAIRSNIGQSDLSKVEVALPALAEQQAIADALSDADALIESLEQLLAKKRQIKQGTMQELLTGQRRLPGFSAEWSETTLIELAVRRKELFDDGDWIESEHITTEGVRLIQTGNIGVGGFVEKDEKKYIFESSFESLRCKEILPGDLLICRLAEPAGRACVLPDIGESKIVTSVDVTIFRPPTTLANKTFLAYVFSTRAWFQAVSDRSGGTTHKRISRGALGRITIRIPPISEQMEIATLLSDMDAELCALETRLTKARQLKQGMAQALLTGRIRLV
jgi:type I restriction enzyme S subunit